MAEELAVMDEDEVHAVRVAAILDAVEAGDAARRIIRGNDALFRRLAALVGAQEHILELHHARIGKHQGGVVICFSHADPIKAAVAHAIGTHLDLFQRIVISTCSVSAISYSAFGPVVLTVNSTGGDLSELRMS